MLMFTDALLRTGSIGDPQRACVEAIEQSVVEGWRDLAHAFDHQIPPGWIEWVVNRVDPGNSTLRSFVETKRAKLLERIPLERAYRLTIAEMEWPPDPTTRDAVRLDVVTEIGLLEKPEEPPETRDPAVSYEGKRDAFRRAGQEPFRRGVSRHREFAAAVTLLSISSGQLDFLSVVLGENRQEVRLELLRALDVSAIQAKWEALFGV